MSTTTKIYVTEKHIEDGVKGDRASCPIALGFADAGFFHASVEYDKVHYYESFNEPHDDGRDAIVAEEIRDWQNAFDSGEYVAPFELELVQYDDTYSVHMKDELIPVD